MDTVRARELVWSTLNANGRMGRNFKKDLLSSLSTS